VKTPGKTLVVELEIKGGVTEITKVPRGVTVKITDHASGSVGKNKQASAQYLAGPLNLNRRKAR